MEKAIEVCNLGKTYKLYNRPQDRIRELFTWHHHSCHTDYRALYDVTFSVAKGETLGIIGCNGAGKSTLLKLITGVITPTDGYVRTDGNISALLELGTGFNPEYNGYENIFLNGSMRGLGDEEINEKLDDIIHFADIGNYMNQPVKTYSSGMFARLAFSVMVHFKPDILIVDEALSVGDVFFQQKCNTYMKEQMQEVTKLLVTHDMNSIANMADRVILLDRGTIVQEGQPLEVIENYLKRMHSSLFAKATADNRGSVIMAAGDRSPVSISASELDSPEDADWIDVDTDDIGGAGEALITAAYLKINHTGGDVVKPGDYMEIGIRVDAGREISQLIVGYLFKDKFGNQIIGENTLGSRIPVPELAYGKNNLIRFYLEWPEVKEGDYFLTIGLGEGTDQMIHKIQCWAHNIIHVEAIALKPMHAVINNPILSLELGIEAAKENE